MCESEIIEKLQLVAGERDLQLLVSDQTAAPLAIIHEEPPLAVSVPQALWVAGDSSHKSHFSA
jgi:hypothetical protein